MSNFDDITKYYMRQIHETVSKPYPINIWLDDRRPMPPDFDIHVKTAPEAIKVLEDHINDSIRISFDHDLGDSDDVGDGYDVAKWIEEQAYYGNIKPVKWTVHSDNPVGIQDIIRAMESAERFWNEKENHEM